MADFQEEYEFMKKIHGVNEFDIHDIEKKDKSSIPIDKTKRFYGLFHSDAVDYRESDQAEKEKEKEKEREHEKVYRESKKNEDKANQVSAQKLPPKKINKASIFHSAFKDLFFQKEQQRHPNEYMRGFKDTFSVESSESEHLIYEGHPWKDTERMRNNKEFMEEDVQYKDLVKDKFWKLRKGEMTTVREGLMESGGDFDEEMQRKNLFQTERLKQKCEESLKRYEENLERFRSNVNELATCDEVVYYIHANNLNLYEYVSHHLDLDKYYLQIKEIPFNKSKDYDDDCLHYIYLNDGVFFKSRKIKESKKEETDRHMDEEGTRLENRDEMERIENEVKKKIENDKKIDKGKEQIRKLLEKQQITYTGKKKKNALDAYVENSEPLSDALGYSFLFLKYGIQNLLHFFNAMFHYDYLNCPYIKRYAHYDCFDSNIKKYMQHFKKKKGKITIDEKFILRNRYLTPFFVHNTVDVNYNTNENGIMVISAILPFVHKFEKDYKLKKIREKEEAIEKELNEWAIKGEKLNIVQYLKSTKDLLIKSIFRKIGLGIEDEEEKNDEKKEHKMEKELEKKSYKHIDELVSYDCAKFLKKFESSITEDGEFLQDLVFPGKVQMIFFHFNSKQFDTDNFNSSAHVDQDADLIKTYKVILGFDKKEHIQYSDILAANVLKSLKKKYPNMVIDDNNPKRYIQYMYYNRSNFFTRNENYQWSEDDEQIEEEEEEEEEDQEEEEEEEQEQREKNEENEVCEVAWEGLVKNPLEYNTLLNNSPSHRRQLKIEDILRSKKKRKRRVPLNEIMEYLYFSPAHLFKKNGYLCEYVTCVTFDNSADSCNLTNNFVLGYNTGKIEYIYGKMDYENMNHCDLLVDYYMNKNKKFTYELNKRYYLNGGIAKIIFAPNGFYCLVLTYNTLYICNFFYSSLCDLGKNRYPKSSIVNMLWLNNNSYAIFCSKGYVYIYEKTAKTETINGFALTKSYFVNQPIYLNSTCAYHMYHNCIYLCTGEIEKKRIKKEKFLSTRFFQNVWKRKRKKKRKIVKKKAKVFTNKLERISEEKKNWTFEEELKREAEKEEREERKNVIENPVDTPICESHEIGSNFINESNFIKPRKKKNLRQNITRKNYFYKFEGNFLMIDLDGEIEKKFVKGFYEDHFDILEKEASNNEFMNANNSNEEVGNVAMDRVGDLSLLMRHVKFLEKQLQNENNGEEFDFQLEKNVPIDMKEFNTYISSLKGMNELLNNRYRTELGLLTKHKINLQGRNQEKEYDLSYFRENRKFTLRRFFLNYITEVLNYLYNTRSENILNILLPRFYSTDMEMNYNNFLNVRYFCIEYGGGHHLIALDTQTDYVYIYEIKKNVYIENDLLVDTDKSEELREKLKKLFDPFSAEIKNLKAYWKIFEDFIFINTKNSLRYIKFSLLYIIKNEKKLYFPLHVNAIYTKTDREEYFLLIKWAIISNCYISSAYNSLSKISKKHILWSEETDLLLKALEEHKDVYVVNTKTGKHQKKGAPEVNIAEWMKMMDKKTLNGTGFSEGSANIEEGNYEYTKKPGKLYETEEDYSKKQQDELLEKIKKYNYQTHGLVNESSDDVSGFSKYKLALLLGKSKKAYPNISACFNKQHDLPNWPNEYGKDTRNINNDPIKYYNSANYPHVTMESNKNYDTRHMSQNRNSSSNERHKRYLMNAQKEIYDKHVWEGYKSDVYDKKGRDHGAGYESERGHYNNTMNYSNRIRDDYSSLMGNKRNYFGNERRNNDFNFYSDNKEPIFYNVENEKIFHSPKNEKKSRFASIINAFGLSKPSTEERNKTVSEYAYKDDYYLRDKLQGINANPNSYGSNAMHNQGMNLGENYYNKNYASATNKNTFYPKETSPNLYEDKFSTMNDMGLGLIYKKNENTTYPNANLTVPDSYDVNRIAEKYETVRNRRVNENVSDPYPRSYVNFRE